MKVAIGLGLANDNWPELESYVVEAERLGVDSVWSAEAWGHDAVTPLAYLAGKTSRVRLGTGIIQVGTRTPALVAMTAMSMQAISGGRFILGFGTSGPQVIEGWHGVPFRQPVGRMRELIECVRIASRGERLIYQGKHYTLPLPTPEGKALRTSARPQEVPIYLATLGPSSLEMTGELANGWVGTSFSPEHAAAVIPHIEAGAKRAGRSLIDIDLQAGGAVAFGDDLDRLIAPRRSGMAFTLGAMGSRQHNFYNAAWQRQGFLEAAKTVQSLWLEGKREDAAMMVPDEMVIGANLLGTEAMVLERVRTYQRAGITTLRAQPEGKTLTERLETLGRLMDLVKQV